jgi:hypothetical protein
VSTEPTTAYVSVAARQALLEDWFRDYLPVLLADSSPEAIKPVPEDGAEEHSEAKLIN